MASRTKKAQTEEKNIIRLTAPISKTKGFAFLWAKPKLSVMKYRVFYLVMSQVKKGDTAETEYPIHVDVLADHIGIQKHKLMENMRKVTKDMIKTVLEWNDETGKIHQTGLLAAASHIPNEYVIMVSVSKTLMPYLILMKEHYDWIYPAGGPLKFDNIYSFPFFDLCNKIVSEGTSTKDKYEKIISIKEMRESLDIAQDSYVDNNPGLNAKIVQPAAKDITEYTFFECDCSPQYEGRKMIGWKITLTYKSGEKPIEHHVNPIVQTLLSLEEPAPSIEELRRVLVDGYGVSWYVFDKFVRDYKNYAADRMWRNMNYIFRMKKKPNSFPRYFYVAVTADIDMKAKLELADKEGKKRAAAATSARLQKEMEEEIEKLNETSSIMTDEEISAFRATWKKIDTTKKEPEQVNNDNSTKFEKLSSEEICAMIDSLPQGIHKEQLQERYKHILEKLKQEEGSQP